MKTRIVGLIVAMLMVFQIVTPVFATSNDISAYNAQKEIIETYADLCDEMAAYADENQIFNTLLDMYPSLTVVESTMAYYDENGEEILLTRSSPSDINLYGDKLVYDDDYGTYIYFGHWEWNNFHTGVNLRPDDVVGFYTQNPDYISALDYFVYGYNSFGTRTAAYIPGNQPEGFIAKGLETRWGAAFYIDENHVRSGRIVVPLSYKRGSSTKVMMAYNHSWSTRNIDGFGVNAHITGFGFDISWSDQVNQWPGPVTSQGVRLPG